MDMRISAMTQDHRADAAGALGPGCSLGPYLILERLSSSRHAEVFLAHDIALERTVVLKAVPSGNDAAGLRHEARALARACNPYVVTLHTVDDSTLTPVLVLEHLVGQTLAQRLERGPLPLATATELFITLLTGLEHMHHAGVIHGNIKPENLFLTTDRQPKFLGLQLAAFRDRSTPVPTSRSPDPLYCAPESRGGLLTDPRADLFSLGMCLYEAVTGGLPFEKKGGRHRRSPPSALLSVLTRATSTDPVARFPSAAAFRDALMATTAAQPDQRRKGARRLLRALAFDIALVAVLAGLVLALGLYPFAETVEPSTAGTETNTAASAKKAGDKSRATSAADKHDKYDALRHAWGG